MHTVIPQHRLVVTGLLLLVSSTYLHAYTSGTGTELDPFVVDSSDTTMTSGWFTTLSDVDFGGTSVYVDASLEINNSVTSSAYIFAGYEGVGTITLNGSDAYLSTGSSSGAVILGQNSSATGTLNINSGAQVVSGEVYVGAWEGSGVLNASGAGSSVQTGNFYVGYNVGTGTAVFSDNALLTMSEALSISNSSSMTISGGSDATAPVVYVNGDLTVTGTGSTFTETARIGSEGFQISGDMSVLDGATVNTTYYGCQLNGSGSLTVSGSGSVFDTRDSGTLGTVNVGYNSGSNSTLLVGNGGTLYTGVIAGGYGGIAANGSITVTGAGSQIMGGVYLGNGGTGQLAIEDGGLVSGDYVTIGGSSNGTALVTGAGSILEVTYGVGGGGLTIGDDYLDTHPSASLTIVDHALVKTDSLVVGEQGVINIDGGYLAVKGDIDQATILSDYSIYFSDGAGGWELADGSSIISRYYTTYGVGDYFGLYDTYGTFDLSGYTIISNVPEPSTYALIGAFASLCYAGCRRRGKRV